MEKRQSVVGELSSGYDAKNVDKEQIGLAHEQEVAKQNNWVDDKHSTMGLPIPKEVKQSAIAQLKTIIAKISELEEEDDEKKTASLESVIMNIASKEEEKMSNEIKEASKLLRQASDLLASYSDKTARHPSEPRDEAAFERAVGSPQMGDDEWVDIGPGTFDDLRNEIGKPA